ncbi:MAG: 2'-5' RNA ligase family protein [Alphaproteobacteria bacterium]|nr:2'-5' RNA ligase family protein [Alphaproteobacteria bacterium]
MKPFILTLQFDAATDAILQTLRAAHFPQEINFIPAHLTVFHQLPGEDERAVLAAIGEVAASAGPFELGVAEPMRLGRGVALRVDAPALGGLRDRLAAPFLDRLIAQDRQKFRPHVTIQNKTTKARAEALYEHMLATWKPLAGTGEGLQLWRYEGGPWSPVAAFALQGA